MICNREDSKRLGIQPINLTQIIDELIRWRRETERENDVWADPVKLAMIDSFEDMIMNAIVED